MAGCLSWMPHQGTATGIGDRTDHLQAWEEKSGDLVSVMRIVQLVNNLDMGGLERLAVDLAYCQLAAGHVPTIYCLAHPGRIAAEAAGRGVCVRSFEKPAGPHLGTVWKMARQ